MHAGIFFPNPTKKNATVFKCTTKINKNILYLSVEASTADGDSLLSYQENPAPVAPKGQSAALWVCTSGKSKLTL